MAKITDPTGKEYYEDPENKTPGGEDKHDTRIRRTIEIILWIIGFVVLMTSAYFTRQHKGPWPGELDFSRTVQAIHYWPWFLTFIHFLSSFNDIPPSIIGVVVVFVFLLLIRWFKEATFFLLTIGVGNGMNILIGDYVNRPRPSGKLIHVTQKLLFNSFPSGHTEHDVVFYGFLLYLTLTKRVREWRYRWILFPFQLFGLIAILGIGYSRVQEGEHWVSDVLAGYLSGLLWLYLMIAVYRLVNAGFSKRRAAKTQGGIQATSEGVAKAR